MNMAGRGGEKDREPGNAVQGGASVGHPVNVATGAVFTEHDDFSIPGRFPLTWSRYYSTDLADAPTPRLPFGGGWYSAWYATLTRVDGEFRFRTPQGSVILIPDPGGLVDKGQAARSLGTFTEVRRQGMFFRVSQWDPAGYRVKAFVFAQGRNGLEWPLRFLEDGTGDGVELAWEEDGRLKGLRQKLEKRTLIVSHEPGGRIASVSFRHGDGRLDTLARYEYDAKGRLAAAYDALGAADRYEYDPSGRIVRESDKDGGVFAFRYDDQGRCVRTSGRDNYDLKTLRYLGNAGITQVTNSYGHTWQFKWLATGQVIEETTPKGGVTATEYDEHGRIAAVTDAAGLKVEYGFDEGGNRALIRYPGGERKTVFDGFHRPLAQADKAGAEFRREYGPDGRLARTVDPVGTEWKFAYDGDGNLVRVDMGDVSVAWEFGPQGLLREGRDAEGRATRYGFDAYGRLETVTGPMGETHSYRHDALGRVTEIRRPDGARISLAYDAGGNLVEEKDGSGPGMRYLYGPCGRLLAVTDALGRTTRLRWGTEPGRLEAIVNPKDEMYRFFHDADGNVIRMVDFAGVEKRFELDVAGRAIAFINGMGERIACERDAAGRLCALMLPDGSRVEYSFDDAGRLARASCPDAVVEVEKDILGRTVKESRGEAWIKYAYDSRGKVASLAASGGVSLAYAYDSGNLLSALEANGSPLLAIERNPLGAEIRRNMPMGLVLEQQVDPSGRLLAQDLFAGPSAAARGAPAVSRRYAWDGMVLTGIRDAAWGESRYAYDAAEQLLRAWRPDKEEWSFGYDPAGNLIRARFGVRLEDCLIGTGDRLLQRGATRFEYDRAGRLIRKTEPSRDPAGGARVWSFEWDALDQLRSLTLPSGEIWRYRYDPMGRRIAKEGPRGATRFLWDRDTLLQDQEDGGRPRAWIMDVHSHRPFGCLSGDGFHPLVTDHLGTPREMLDPQGNPVWSALYGPFGEVEEESGAGDRCPLRFPGQWLDSESGLHYNHYRYYDPATGRYLSPDPVGLLGGMNAYRYTPNPVNWIDPLGLDWNYVLVDPAGKVYYTGVASDNETPCGVMRRHANNPKDGSAPQRFNPHPDPSIGDQMYQVTPKGTDHETARGLEQRIAADHDLVIGRRGSADNPTGSVRGNNQNPVDQRDSNKKRDSRAKAAQDHLDAQGKTTDDLIADAMKKGPLEKCK